MQVLSKEFLEKTNKSIGEIYSENPERVTDKTTTSLLLRAFDNISLVFIEIEGNR